MASARFLEDALSTDVDESAVNAIVGSLENQFVTSSSTPSTQNTFININPNQLNIASSGSSIIGVQKYNADRSNPNEVKIVNSVNFSNAEPHAGVVFNNVSGSMHNFLTAVTNVPQSNLTCVPNSNDQIKVIYSQSSQAVPTITSNRLSFPAQSLANGSIALSAPQNIINSVVSGNFSGNKSITMQPPLVIKQGNPTGQVGMQTGLVSVPMSVNSSMPASINNVMTLNKPVGQNVITSNQNMGGNNQPTIIPNVQILNMRPGAPNVSAQKSVATVSPRVVIGAPQVVGTRPAASGITLQTLQGLQPGQQGHLLLKTENGQYQLLRVGPAPAANTLTAPPAQTIRLSTVPAHPGVATVSTSVAAPQMQAQIPSSPMPVAPASSSGTPPPQSPNVTTQKPSDNTKEKCRNFLANLLDLSSKEPKSVERNVRQLIQELIDALVEPEEFCDRLEKLLNASPQPCLIGFLKKSLPLLRQSLVTKELVIEGINPPAPHVAFSTGPAPAHSVINTSNMQLAMNEGQFSTLLPPPPALPLSMAQMSHMQMPTAKTVNIITATPLQPMQQNQHQQRPQSKNTIAVLQNIPIQPQKLNVNKVSSAKVVNKNLSRVGGNHAALNTVLTPGKSMLKDKDKKASQQFAAQQFAADDKMAGDDDINDVAAMGGVNLAEESQRILGSTELIGTQIRSCKDEYLLPMHQMQARIRAAAQRHGLDEPSAEVAGLLSHAVHERLKNIVEKLAVIAQHRIDLLIKTDPRYEVTQDVKGQLKFLEELDRMEKKRREDSEREILLRAAKSRSKNEDPEQAKLKAKAKEMQRAELEELRQREANLTALQAIGPRKKPRLDGPGGAGDFSSSNSQSGGISGRGQMALRTRLKRINHRDVVFLLEQEKETAHSPMLYRCYLK